MKKRPPQPHPTLRCLGPPCYTVREADRWQSGVSCSICRGKEDTHTHTRGHPVSVVHYEKRYHRRRVCPCARPHSTSLAQPCVQQTAILHGLSAQRAFLVMVRRNTRTVRKYLTMSQSHCHHPALASLYSTPGSAMGCPGPQSL